MRVSKASAAGLMALAFMNAASAGAQNTGAAYMSPVAANAENIRSLNIMLMVTSLRCRQSAHDFRGEYDMFSRTHQQNLAEAHDHLSRNLAASYGTEGTKRALDRIGVGIANRYGDGHPTLGCADLKRAAFQLARSQDRQMLSQMADSLLAGELMPANAPAERQYQPPEQAPVILPEPKLEYDAEIMGQPVPQRPDGAGPDDTAPAKVPIWLRG